MHVSPRNAGKAIAATTLAAASVVGIVAGQAAAVTPATSDTVFVDSRDVAGTVSSLVLAPGVSYTVTVKGTFSAWTYWTSKRCGKVEPAPMWASPARLADTPVGYDAEFMFASPASPPKSCKTKILPRPTGRFQLRQADNPASKWHHPTPTVEPSKPSNNHQYKYTIVGNGSALEFRVTDFHYIDNNGRLRVTVAPAGSP